MNLTSPSSLPPAERFLVTIGVLTNWLGRSVPPIVDIDYLRSLPMGSFGRTWAETLDAYALEPLTAGGRRQQLHDGIHVLTGYGTDPLGEAEVQAFLMGAKFRLVHVLLMLGLLRGIVQKNFHGSVASKADFSNRVWPRLWQAYQLGKQSTLDPDTWQPEVLWSLDLEAVRYCFKIA